MASLLASLLLAAPDAHAGSYTVTYGGGTVAVTAGNGTVPSPAFSTGHDYYGGTSTTIWGSGDHSTPSGGVVVDKSPSLTAALAWVPASGQTAATDPPPTAAILYQYCDASASLNSQEGGGAGSGTASCGLPNAVNTPTATAMESVATSYSAASVSAGGAITVSPCAATATFTGSVGMSYRDYAAGGAGVTYDVEALPVTMRLDGTTPDSSGNLNILVGQQCTATLVVGTDQWGDKFSGSLSNFRWAVSGTTFESWGVASDANGQSHTVEVDAIPATNPTQWYWNDLQAASETVKCTVTVTPPAGQGSPFDLTVTAPKPVSVQVPSWFGYETGGYMQVNTTAPNTNGAITLHAGPNAGQSGGGMNWTANVASSTLFASGTLELVQVVTPNMSYVTYTGVGVPGITHNDPENGKFGLDTRYPYDWVTTGGGGPSLYVTPPYTTNDSPYISLVSSIASVTMQHQFTDYLMFQPPGSSQWVPLGTNGWSTNGNAIVPTTDNWTDYVKQNGSDSAGSISPTANTPFTPGNTFPSWARINAFPSF